MVLLDIRARARRARSRLLLAADAFERLAALLLVHDSTGSGIALGVVAVRGLELAAASDLSAAVVVPGVLRHVATSWCCARPGWTCGHQGVSSEPGSIPQFS